MKYAKICPKCGGKMVYEELVEFGRKHFITNEGEISKRSTKIEYGSTDVQLYYCDNCGWSPYKDCVVD
jgi:predicted RNA-binding Zn-ribbon protein involved in translation (DUF1610 family)